MALADTARLIASLELKDLFSKQIGSAEKSLGSFDKKLDQTQTRAYRAGQQIGTGIKRTAALAVGAIGFLGSQVALGVNSLVKLDDVILQTNAVLKSTKGAAGENAAAIRDLANKYENLNATIDDTVIQSGENLLLTFTNIRKDAFEPTLKAALDMNQALGGGEAGLQGTIQRLGKALNDPVKGLTALQRVGVTFTKTQKDEIAAAVKAGDTFKAQGIILAELNKRFGGSFIAGGQGAAGKFAKVKDAVDDLQRALATALLPVLTKVADKVSTFLSDPAVVAQVSKLGDSIAGLFSDKNLTAGADILKGAFQTFKEAAPFLEAAAKATLGFVQAAVGVFKSLPAPLQGLIAGGFALNKLTGGLVTNIAGGIADLIGKARGATPANPVFVADVSGGLGGVGGKAGLLPALGSIVTKLGGLALVLGGLTALSAGTQAGGPGGAGIGALGAGATIAGGALLAGPLGAIVASLGVVGKTLLDIRDSSKVQGDQIATSIQSQLSGGAKLSDLRTSLAAVNTGINDIQANPLNVLVAGDALDQLRAQKALLEKSIAQAALDAARGRTATVNAATGFTTGSSIIGKAKDDIVNLAQLQKSSLSFLRDQFREMLSHLSGAKTAAAIKQAIKEVELNIFARGKGGVGGAEATIAALKKAIGNTHDPKLQASLRAELRRVEKQLNYRTIVQAQLKKADQIFRSNESSKRKIEELKGIQKTLSSKDLAAQKAVQTKIDALKRAQVYAAHGTTHAIKDKDLSVRTSVNVKTVVPVTVNAREVGAAVASFAKAFVTSSSGSGGSGGKYAT